MPSVNIKIFKDFWNEFEKQTTFTVKDMQLLNSKLAYAMKTVHELEISRDNWKKRALQKENLNKNTTDGN